MWKAVGHTLTVGRKASPEVPPTQPDMHREGARKKPVARRRFKILSKLAGRRKRKDKKRGMIGRMPTTKKLNVDITDWQAGFKLLDSTGGMFGPGSDVLYDASSPWKVLFRFAGTALQRIVTLRRELYFYLAVYVLTVTINAVLLTIGTRQLPKMPADLIGPVATFLTIMLVFYNQQALRRFMAQYESCMDIIDGISDSVVQMCTLFPEHPAPTMHTARLLNAAHAYCILELNEELSKAKDLVKFVTDQKLLTREEQQSLQEWAERRDKSGRKGLMIAEVCIGWAMQMVCHQLEVLDPPLASDMIGLFCKVKDNMQVLYDYRDMPIPFAYFHFQSLSVFLFNVILSYTAGTNDENGIGFLTLMPTIFGCLSLREVSVVLSDPFGNDSCDLPAIHYIENLVQDCRRVILEMYSTQQEDKDLHDAPEFGTTWTAGDKI